MDLEIATPAGAARQAAETAETPWGDSRADVLSIRSQATPEPPERYTIVVERLGIRVVRETGACGIGRLEVHQRQAPSPLLDRKDGKTGRYLHAIVS
jgi:hypothetical protein